MSETKRDLQQIFRTRVPWWARLIGAVRASVEAGKARKRAAREAQRFRYVATVHHCTYWTDVKHHDYNFYTLEENGHGERRVTYSNSNYLLERDAKQTRTYLRFVQPWLSGQISNETAIERGKLDCDAERRWAAEDNEHPSTKPANPN